MSLRGGGVQGAGSGHVNRTLFVFHRLLLHHKYNCESKLWSFQRTEVDRRDRDVMVFSVQQQPTVVSAS